MEFSLDGDGSLCPARELDNVVGMIGLGGGTGQHLGPAPEPDDADVDGFSHACLV